MTIVASNLRKKKVRKKLFSLFVCMCVCSKCSMCVYFVLFKFVQWQIHWYLCVYKNGRITKLEFLITYESCLAF